MSTSPCIVYANGLCVCSACAPLRYSADMIAEEVNKINPTGISSKWTISKEAAFITGEPIPCPCNDFPSERQHWLLEC